MTKMTKAQLEKLSRLGPTSKLTKAELAERTRLGCPTCGNYEAEHAGAMWGWFAKKAWINI
jgi:hypothetical protein